MSSLHEFIPNSCLGNNAQHIEKLAVLSGQMTTAQRAIRSLNDDIETLNEWTHRHELEHKDVKSSLDKIETILTAQEKRYQDDQIKIAKENERKSKKFINFVKESKEVIGLATLIAGIISAILVWIFQNV